MQRVPLTSLGISPLNRPVSGKRVHSLGRRIVSVEGFCLFRYKFGRCHEPNPNDPLEVWRFTDRIAKRDKLHANVAKAALYGSFAKTHSMSFLHAMASGTVYWDDTGNSMVPPPAQQVLLEHIQHGAFYEVISYEAVAKAAGSVKALMASDNFDVGFALGQTEMQLLVAIRDCTHVARPPAGSTVWDEVYTTVARAAGARWTQDDIASLFNFTKVVSREQLDFLSSMVTLHAQVDKGRSARSRLPARRGIAPQAPLVQNHAYGYAVLEPGGSLGAGPWRQGLRGSGEQGGVRALEKSCHLTS